MTTAYRSVLPRAAFLLVLSAAQLAGADEIAALRRELAAQKRVVAEQQEILRSQSEKLRAQQEKIESFGARLAAMEQSKETMRAQSIKPAQPPGASMAKLEASDRDSVGDLNSAAVKAGEFPGSIAIPGDSKVSLAVGGFIKTLVINDSNSEASGPVFLPATLGMTRDDKDGQTQIDASLSRVNIDVRAPLDIGATRGYVEFDFNDPDNFKLRHAYGSLKGSAGEMLAGQTWTTFMDTLALPEGLGEPTVSGAVFQRQPLVRYTTPASSGASASFAVEDANSSDVFDLGENIPGKTTMPDLIPALQWYDADLGHVRLAGVYRRIELDPDGKGGAQADGWGLQLSGHVPVRDRDSFMLSGVYGDALGRYLLGIAPDAGAIVDPSTNTLYTRSNYGGYGAYQFFWADALRSNLAFGYARSEPKAEQPGLAFESTMFGLANILWSVRPELTLGVEYNYGVRDNKDGSDIDNNRIMFGIQFY